MKKVKITVLRCSFNEDFAREYGMPELKVCSVMKEGQEFVAGLGRPDGLCDGAWRSIHQYVFALANGAERFFFNDWARQPGVAVTCCNDGFRPVFFKLETMEEEVESPFPKNINRMKSIILVAILMSATGTAGATGGATYKNQTDNKNMSDPKMTQQWDKVFPLSDKVDHKKVTFTNRYGITLAADMYTPKNADGKLAAIAVAGPFGAIKEQVSGLYAQTMAERGFVTIAFDPSYTGESGGEPRYVASPDINTEDFSAAVDFLTTQDNVDPERIGIIGVCGWGGLAINAAAMDTRIKATVASTMYDMSRVNANGYFDSMDADARYELREQLNAQRTVDAKNGTYALGGGVADPLPDDAPQFVKDYYSYYKTGRGYHPRSLNSNEGWNITSSLSFINMPQLTYAGEIRNAVLIIHGEKAHSRYFGEDAFKMLTGDNKELMIIPGASHVDLYDRTDIIPFDKLDAFFTEYLK